MLFEQTAGDFTNMPYFIVLDTLFKAKIIFKVSDRSPTMQKGAFSQFTWPQVALYRQDSTMREIKVVSTAPDPTHKSQVSYKLNLSFCKNTRLLNQYVIINVAYPVRRDKKKPVD